MSYPTKYRERTIEYRKAGHTLEETHQTFKVSISTIRQWEKQLEKEGNLEKKPLHRSYKKVNPEKLKAYLMLFNFCNYTKFPNHFSIPRKDR